ncbi:MAG: hypothetical protein IKO40_09440 [Kiritimatiellae bacterium]|nr:hypothetical protein [Kiritimatiellia bacterium]
MNSTKLIGAAALAAVLAGCATPPSYRDETEVRTYSDHFTASDYEQTATAMLQSLFSREDIIANVAAYRDAHGGAKPKILVNPVVNNTRQMTFKADVINDAIKTEIVRSGMFAFVGNEKAMIDRKIIEDNSILTAPGSSSGFLTQRGADYALTSTLTQLDDEGGRTREKVYILAMQLDNLVTGEPEWAERKAVRKVSQRAGLGW